MPELSDLDTLPKGLTVRPLFAQDHQDNLVLQNRVGSLIDLDRTPMSALGQIKPDAGIYIHVAPDVTITKPLYLRMVAMGADHDIIIHRHLSIWNKVRALILCRPLEPTGAGMFFTKLLKFLSITQQNLAYISTRRGTDQFANPSWEFAVAEAGSVKVFHLHLAGRVRQDLHAKLTVGISTFSLMAILAAINSC